MNIDDRHRSLLVAALHSHAEKLDEEIATCRSLRSGRNNDDWPAYPTAQIREADDALDLARDIECSR